MDHSVDSILDVYSSMKQNSRNGWGAKTNKRCTLYFFHKTVANSVDFSSFFPHACWRLNRRSLQYCRWADVICSFCVDFVQARLHFCHFYAWSKWRRQPHDLKAATAPMWTSLTLNGGDVRRRWWETLEGILRIAVVPVQTATNELELSWGRKKIKTKACYMMFPQSAATQFPGRLCRMWSAGPCRLLWGTAPSETQC